ncbi:MAG: IS1595 family transposase [bacterium]
MKVKCPHCQNQSFWRLRDGRLKCQSCHRRFSQSKPCLAVSRQLLRRIISEFLLEHSTNVILSRVKISKYKLLKILTLLRIVMAKDVPQVFSGIVEVDETYLGGQMKNKRKKIKLKLGKNRRGFGTIKQPVFGILCREGKVWAEIVQDTEAKDLQPLIERQVKKGSTICSDKWRGYTGLAAKGYVHRLVDHGKKEYSDKKGHHINGLEGFWGYLKRKLSAKGGVRQERLPLYLGEYVWRYNHRQFSLKEQENLIFKLIYE